MTLRTFIMTIALIAAGAFAVACPSDDGGTTADNAVTDNAVADNAVTDNAVADNATPDAAGDSPVVTTDHFIGQLMDFASKTGRKGVDLLVLDNDTGEPLDTTKWPVFKSGDEGVFELDLPAGTNVGFKASGKEDTSTSTPMTFNTTYMFNIPSDAQGKRIYAVNNVTYITAPAAAGIKVDKTKGILAGTIYWKNPDGDKEEFVGCATVETIPVGGTETMGDIRYFDPDNDLPGPLTQAPFTTTGRYGTSRYIIANLPVGRYRLIVKVDGVEVNVGQQDVLVFAYADSIAISNVYVEKAGDPNVNPTPDRDECFVEQNNPT